MPETSTKHVLSEKSKGPSRIQTLLDRVSEQPGLDTDEYAALLKEDRRIVHVYLHRLLAKGQIHKGSKDKSVAGLYGSVRYIKVNIWSVSPL